jgi:hypothetical protein
VVRDCEMNARYGFYTKLLTQGYMENLSLTQALVETLART